MRDTAMTSTSLFSFPSRLHDVVADVFDMVGVRAHWSSQMVA